MKKIISIFILFCLVIYIGGYHLVYELYQMNIKQEMKMYLKGNTDTKIGSYFSFKLVKDGVTDPFFHWEDGNEEFKYHNEWYDVVTIEKYGDSIKICSLKDERENKLENQLQQIHQHSHSRSSSASVSALKLFSLFYPPIKDKLMIYSFSIANAYVAYKQNGMSTDQSIPYPPPRV